ncbi:DUF1292 domain-containing protein [Alicyclobacillus tolerans]|uniref:DUF1292 domain-containing protein n=1 Tax=Alicyclobacillus tolerans TaxID=90970 RepID=UPI001F1CEB01|nr:DUF1292 domain-containing protein [Alicyclobacillus tolerans]MCF8564099.1 DUF1292 domain-containing protein [Alicyclobacillus tolerans]
MSCSCGKDSCGCSTTPKVIHLLDDLGNMHPFYIADRLFLANQRYVYVVSLEDDQSTLLKVMEDADGNESYLNIPDEAEWKEIEVALSTLT